ncbi:hypothetical protein OHA79_39755 [Streptomyces sp. NBC_00841]|uniref:hypothetical protein n=1 Tax=unclassified Streptomyces TaxID=2593676 RepID=UPI00224EA075|nr:MULTISPECIES: hypothetical protein [unclassified Streptomyces]MCX4530838.1 hypothetical protein [Streptomyces sp. NBC_01669]WSA03420.1 hypothetical protein OHA79_39755 [Streptomyces sp. NBC_00841]
MICVDCDGAITGAYVVVAFGDSMSAARADSYAHAPKSLECKLRSRSKMKFRRVLDGVEREPVRARR